MKPINHHKYQTGYKKTHSLIMQALNHMKADEELAGWKSTEEFVSALQKHLKVVKVCQANDLTGCFPEKITAGEDEYELKDMKTSSQFGKEWNDNTNIMGIVLLNGTSMLTTYNTQCDPEINIENCAAFVYDLDNIHSNNKYLGNGESDITTFNASFSKALNCGTGITTGYFPTGPGSTSSGWIMDGPDGNNIECITKNTQLFQEITCAGDNQLSLYEWDGKAAYYCPCLARGTMITLANGDKKPIEEIDYDDKLKVWDFDNGKMSESKPIWIKKPQITDKYNLLTFSDGTQLKTISQHRIFNKEAGKFTYPMTDDTPLGTTTFLEDGREVQLVDKKFVYEPVEFYNILTEYHFNCFANGVCTSNRFNNMYKIENYKFVKEQREVIPYEKVEKLVSREWYEKLRLAEMPEELITEEHLNMLTSLNKRDVFAKI